MKNSSTKFVIAVPLLSIVIGCVTAMLYDICLSVLSQLFYGMMAVIAVSVIVLSRKILRPFPYKWLVVIFSIVFGWYIAWEFLNLVLFLFYM
jgi:hypothetical protein